MMHLRNAALLVLMLALPWALHAQAISMGGSYSDVPRLEFGANYNFFHANAPPGHCGCFSLNGGSATVVYNITSKWAGIADLTLGHASNVNNTGQNITIFNYLFGPRSPRRMSRRHFPSDQILLRRASDDVKPASPINP